MTLSTLEDTAVARDVGELGYWRAIQALLDDWAARRLESNSEWSEFTEALGACLMPGEVGSRLKGILGTHKRVRIWIESQDPKLRQVPWEAAQASFLSDRPALMDVPGLSVFRRSASQERVAPPPPSGELVVKFAVGPPECRGLTVDRLADPGPLLADLRDLPGLRIDRMGECRLATLAASVAGGHIFHFSGHAATNASMQEQRLLLFSDTGDKCDEVGVLGLDPALDAAADLRVVVLAACGTGASFPTHGGWAELDVDVVIAMQRAVTDKGATAFTRGFYRALSESGDLDDAVSAGRVALASVDSGRGAAQTPVVYCRYLGGPISLRATTPPAPADSAVPTGERQGQRNRVRRPLVRMEPTDGAEQPLEVWLDGPFGHAVGLHRNRPRSIAPFIGPGVLQADSRNEQILWDPALELVLDEDEALKRFVTSLLLDRTKERTPRSVEALTAEQLSVSQLRIALARLAERATAAFAGHALEAAVPLNLFDTHQVRLGAGEDPLPQLDDVLERLERHNLAHPATPLLGGDRMASRLREFKRHVKSEGLSGSGVEWLTDLFWHTVIFDSPLYPHVTELSLQVSLLAGRRRRPTRRLDPATAVVRSGLSDLRLATGRSVERGYDPTEPTSGVRRRLYRAIGEVLHADYARWVRRRNPQSHDVIPMALTTTFDLEMERGLAACGHPYEVAIPIYLRVETEERARPDGYGDAAPGSRTEEAVRWLIGRFDPCDDPSIEALRRPTDGWRQASSLRAMQGGAIDLSGPLLLKLNGSPSHEVRGPDEDGYIIDLPDLPLVNPQASTGVTPSGHPDTFGAAPTAMGSAVTVEIEHAISLGEYDFLQLARMSQYSFDNVSKAPNASGAVLVEDGLPGLLVDQIRFADRFWMLLGHRFADWNSRTQIHTYIAHEAQNTERGCAVSLEFDQDRIRFLDWLGITHTKGPISQLIGPLEQLASAMGSRT